MGGFKSKRDSYMKFMNNLSSGKTSKSYLNQISKDMIGFKDSLTQRELQDQ